MSGNIQPVSRAPQVHDAGKKKGGEKDSRKNQETGEFAVSFRFKKGI